MDHRLAALESNVRDLAARVRELERRVADPGPSHAPGAGLAAAASASAEGDPTHASRHRSILVESISLTGRSLVVLGGAYLLRALTDAGTLAPAAGIALGLAYATLWIAVADRAASSGRRASAVFHAVTAAFIFFPLLWEGTTRFGVLTPAWSAGVLGAASAVTLLIAAHTRLQTLAVLVVVGALPASVALVAATGSLLPFALYLIGLGLATLWLGYDREWIVLRWPCALVADVMAIGLAVRAVADPPRDAPMAAIAVQLLLLGGYLGMIGARTVIRARDVIPFEVAQTIGALVAGFGSAAYVASATSSHAGLLGIVTIGFGAAAYALAFVFIDARQRTNFYFYTSVALIYVTSGTGLVLGTRAAAPIWAALAVLAALLSQRTSRVTLSWHAAAFAVAAAAGSGLFGHASAAWLNRAATAWPAFTTEAALALAATGACTMIRMPVERRAIGGWVCAPRLALVTLFVLTAGGTLVGWAAALVGPGTLTPGALATIRTGVLAVAALALAGASRIAHVADAAWLAYPVLLAGALKVLLEDFPRSTPATLFAALATYGAALLMTPRLLRTAAPGQPGREPAAAEVPETRQPESSESPRHARIL